MANENTFYSGPDEPGATVPVAVWGSGNKGRAAIRAVRRIFAQPAFDSIRGEEIAPGTDRQTDEELDSYLRETAISDIHSVGTCR